MELLAVIAIVILYPIVCDVADGLAAKHDGTFVSFDEACNKQA